MQYLAVEQNQLEATPTQSLLKHPFEEGLSASERSLHPVLALAAMPLSVSKTSGAGLTICYGIHTSPLGEILIATTAQGVCNLHFLEDGENTESILRFKWKNATLIQDLAKTQVIYDRLFPSASPSSQESISLWVRGTDFQVRVWQALLTIPFGQVTTYQAIATAIGQPTASRAVGNAIGQNPIAYLIPCHRVIRESGALGGYYWGIERKAAILAWESKLMLGV